MEETVKQRLIQFIKYKGIGQGKFEKIVGLSNGYINQLKYSPSPQKLQMIIGAFPDLNQSWLMTGEGDMLCTSPPPASSGEVLTDYETWLLPMSTHAGSLVGIPSDTTMLQNCEKIVCPIKGVDFAITVYGDSMAPEYQSGSKVLIKKIDPSIFIEWGKVYVLDTSNGVVIKEVRACEKTGYITCHSLNEDPKYADFDVPMSEIYGMYKVLMCISAK